MKKNIALFVCLTVLMGIMGCGKSNDTMEESKVVETVDVEDATALLSDVWSMYEEADKFPVSGGGYDNMSMEGPGKIDVTQADTLDSLLGVPGEGASMIDDAASMLHMMNANTFTAGAYHLTDASNQQKFEDLLKDNIMNRQWMCGFPETLIIVSVGEEYVVSAFGKADMIETFKTKLQAQYEAAEVIYEENLME